MKPSSLSRYVFTQTLTICLVSILILGAFGALSQYFSVRQRSARFSRISMADSEDLLRQQTRIAISYIERTQSQTESRLMDSLRDRVHEAHALASHLYTRFRDSRNPAAIAAMIREALRPIRFYNGRGYYFATRLDGVQELLADRPENEGRNLLGVRDPEGRLLFQDMIAIARDPGQGFYRYAWTRPGSSGINFPKLAFIKRFDPLGWLIGTGEYLIDFEHDIQQEVTRHLDTLAFGRNGHILAGGYDGPVLVGPAKGQNTAGIRDAVGMPIYQELIRLAQAGGGFLRYPALNPAGGDPLPMLSYVEPIASWGWFVGAEINTKDIEAEIRGSEESLNRSLLLTFALITAVTIGVLGLSLAGASRLARHLDREVGALGAFFAQAAEPGLTPEIDMKTLRFNELERIADSAQEMVRERTAAEQAQAEAERRYRETETRMLQMQKLESLGALAGGIAHDFSNLLGGIMGNAELALQELPPKSQVREEMRDIIKSSQQAAELCRQMLAYAGKGRFVVKILDLNALIREMTPLLEVTASKKATLTYDLAAELLLIEAEATQIRQILLNLLTNASEALQDRAGAITVRTGSEHCSRSTLDEHSLGQELPEGEYVFLEVADTGCGMDAETQKKVFDPFFSTKFAGRGLGLAATQGILQSHRGTIKMASAPGEGSSFKVLLPRCSASQPHAEPAAASQPSSKEAGTVLFVDDEPGMRAVGKRMLESLGFKVLIAAEGKEAVEVFEKQSEAIIVVLLDLTMPVMDGVETGLALRRLRPNLTIILTSGYNEQETGRALYEQAPTFFLQKPYTLKTIQEIMKKALENMKGGP